MARSIAGRIPPGNQTMGTCQHKRDESLMTLVLTVLNGSFLRNGSFLLGFLDTEHRLSRKRVWMIDPLDGTTGFIEGNGDFAVQIGLADNGQCVLGVVYQPLTGVLYRAVQGGGTWIERPEYEPEKAAVSGNDEISAMRLAASRSHRSPRMDSVVQAFGLKEEVRRGSVGIKVGLIVEKQCDLYVHLSPRTKQWDTCAPEIILREAGGSLTDLLDGHSDTTPPEVQNRNGVVASNGVVPQTNY